MSLYTRIFGENEDAAVILGFAGVNKNMFMRYRDCYLNPEGTKVTVVTRIGGDNRKSYKPTFNIIRKYENYIRDYDDKFDKTYCYFEFKVNEKYLETSKKMAPKEEHLSVGEMFKKEAEEADIPGTPAAKRQEEIAKFIFDAMERGDHFIGL